MPDPRIAFSEDPEDFVRRDWSDLVAADPAGLWLTQEKDAKIRVAKCAKDTFCGTITWLKEPIDPKTGKPQVDDKNKNPELQNRKIIGLRIFSMALEDSGKWAGKIYNAEDGNEYDASIKVPDTDLNSDMHAKADYRAHLVTVMAKRAVAKALG